MSRIVVVCEGPTEELAVRHFVARQWQKDGMASVGLHYRCVPPRQVGAFACATLDKPDVIAVFTLIDLYGMNLVDHRLDDELDAKAERVRSWLRTQVQHHRRAQAFFPHVSVHEVEAWILAEGTALALRLKDPSIGPDPRAEWKNFQKPPKKRINELFLRDKKTRYKETFDGQALFSKMEFQPVYDSCPYFRKFYDDLRTVGRA